MFSWGATDPHVLESFIKRNFWIVKPFLFPRCDLLFGGGSLRQAWIALNQRTVVENFGGLCSAGLSVAWIGGPVVRLVAVVVVDVDRATLSPGNY